MRKRPCIQTRPWGGAGRIQPVVTDRLTFPENPETITLPDRDNPAWMIEMTHPRPLSWRWRLFRQTHEWLTLHAEGTAPTRRIALAAARHAMRRQHKAASKENAPQDRQ